MIPLLLQCKREASQLQIFRSALRKVERFSRVIQPSVFRKLAFDLLMKVRKPKAQAARTCVETGFVRR
jgi:hypothetical protein